jgi:hypothetical protein
VVFFLAAGLRAAVFLRVVFLRVVLRAALFFAAGFLRVVFLRVVFFAAGLRAAVFLLRVVLRAAVLRFAVDLFFAGDIGHPLSIGIRTPCVSGVAVLVRSSLPTPRTAHRDEGRS